MSRPERVLASFRDPSGFVFRRGGTVYRQVNRSFAERYERLLDSGLYDALTSEGLLIRHEEDPSQAPASDEAYKILRPEPVPFISYPYEWSFGQLRDAALTTLRIQRIALDHGMTLRDAPSTNIQFLRGRPVLIDSLSFEPLKEGEPWVAYRQFCQHFLAPLALMSYVDPRLGQLLQVHVDGIPLDLAAGLMPGRARLRLSLVLHLFAHARTQRRGPPAKPSRGNRRFTLQAFRGLIDSLEGAIRKLRWDPKRSPWVGYYAESESYSAEAAEHKRELVAKFLDEASPDNVWDLGANTGAFSRIASDRGIPTVSFDVDAGCVQASYDQAVATGETHLLPLVLDLTSPSPPSGWANRERLSLEDRGPVDLAMALALVHHLAIGNNVPLDRLASFFERLCRWLIAEFVPKSDPKVEELLQVREDVFPTYTVEGFEAAFGERFSIVRREPIAGSERVLYLMRRAS